MEKVSTENKRLDLQGVRGLAILSVLGFHFLPRIFPNGYLGVDQFFVLSGFFMCKLLRKSSASLNSQTIFGFVFNFYSKRLKRILPLYLLIIFVSLIFLIYLFPKPAYETNLESSKRALIFLSNRPATQAEDYFSMLSLAIDVFTHTWSLSVEVQFYFIIPIIFLFGIKTIPARFQMHFFGILGIISYGYSYLFCSRTKAFNSVLARIWQFMIGMIVFIASEPDTNTLSKVSLLENCDLENQNEDDALLKNASSVQEEFENFEESNSPTIIKLLTLGSMVGLVLCPLKISSLFLRPFFTIATGLVMLFSEKDSFLSFHFLTYIGDISYSLYLIHWPIYAFWKLQLSSGSIWNLSLLLAFGLSVILAVLSYEFFEKWYLKLSRRTIAIICIVFLMLNFTTVYHDQIEKWIQSKPHKNVPRLDGIVIGNVSYDDANRLNNEWSVNDYLNTFVPTCKYDDGSGPFGRCNHTGLEVYKGKFKILIIGNSFAANHGRLIHQECGSKARELVQISISACEPLYPAVKYGQRCVDTVEMFKKVVADEKPDYAFLTSRFLDIGDPFAAGVTRVEDDPIYKSMKKSFDVLVTSVKFKVFVFMQIPEIVPSNIEKIVEVIKNKEDLAEFDKSFVQRNHTIARVRYEKMVQGCEKCVPFDYDSLFWNRTTSTWRFYDEANNGLSYMTTINHLSFHGLELVRHIFSNLCSSF